jgi:hypothetical protein
MEADVGLIAVLAVLTVLYAVLRFGVSPWVKTKWKASSPIGKISRAGAIAAIGTATTFLQVSLIALGVVTIIIAVAMLISPMFAGRTLVSLNANVHKIDSLLDPARTVLGKAMLWIAVAGLFYLAWRATRGELQKDLHEERVRQLNDLLAKAQGAGLEPLPPNSEMDRCIATLGAIDERLAELDSVDPEIRPAAEARMREIRDETERQLLIADLDRRVDLTEVPVKATLGEGLWPPFRPLFSKGAVTTVQSASKWTGRFSTAALAVLLLGVSAPATHSLGLIPMLDRLTDLQLAREDKEATQSLNQLARTSPPPQPAPQSTREEDDPADAQIYQVAARQFIQALAHSQAWRGGVRQAIVDVGHVGPTRVNADAVSDLAVRDTLLREYAAGRQDAAELIPASVEVPDQADVTRRYQQFRDRTTAARPRGPDEAVAKVERLIQAKAESSPQFARKLRDGVSAYLASFGQPAAIWDYGDAVVGEFLDPAIKAGLPGADGLVQTGATKSGRKAAGDAAKRVVRIQLNNFLQQIAGGNTYADALSAVREAGLRPGHVVLTRAEARQVRVKMDAAASDSDSLARAGRRSPPSLTARTRETERRVLKGLIGGVVGSSRDVNGAALRASLEGSAGSYDDLFPGQEASLRRTPLGEALKYLQGPSALPEAGAPMEGPSGVGGGGGGGGEKARPIRASGPAFRSRSYMRLAGSFRVGGVLIGADPEPQSSADFRRLLSQRDGSGLRLVLVEGSGRRLDLGRYSGTLVQQALAYAADGRVTAATMTKGPLTGRMLRVQLHPALLNTAAGCSIIAVDRFVDQSTGEDAARNEWNRRVSLQLLLYNQAIRRAAEDHDTTSLKELADQLEDASPSAVISLAFPAGWNSRDPRQSVFAHHKVRFDQDLVARLSDCGTSLAEGEPAYWSCVIGGGVDSSKYVEQKFQPWSGVRETAYRLDRSILAGDIQRIRLKTSTAPLRFIDQVAFEREAERGDCDSEDCVANDAVSPWEFPVLGGRIQAGVEGMLAKEPNSVAMLQTARDFAMLQRIFRAALNGDLGHQFEKGDLVQAMRLARQIEPIRSTPTPEWSVPRSYAGALLSAQADHFALKRRLAQMTLLANTDRNSEAGQQSLVCARAIGSNPDSGYTNRLHEACSEMDRPVFDELVSVWASTFYLSALLDPSAGSRFAGETCRGQGG